jgi:hypothetical protein
MLDPETTAVITGAAGNIVAYMLTGRIDALRAWISRVLKEGNPADLALQLRVAEDDCNALARQLTSEADVKARWSTFLAGYLTEHPGARAEIEAMAAFRSAVPEIMNIGEQHNYGGTFVGRDNYGDIRAQGV